MGEIDCIHIDIDCKSFTFYNYNELQEKALYQAERQFLTQQVENYAVQLQEMSKTWQQAREYRHDMKQKVSFD